MATGGSGSRKRSSRKAGKTPPRGGISARMTRGAISKQFQKQRAEARRSALIRTNKARAKASRDAFKPRRGDRGKLVLVTSATQTKKRPGQRSAPWTGGGGRASLKGRKGFLVYVTRTGKKRLIREAGRHGTPENLKPRRLKDIEVPIRRNLKRAAKKFLTAQHQSIAHRKIGKLKTEREVRIPKQTGGHDFSEKTVKKIAKDLKKALESTASRRSYIISVAAVVRFSDLSSDTIEFSVPIARQDHQAIEIGGIENFVRMKFYAFMARELAFKGYVTAGSANHIRNQLGLPAGAPVGQAEWEEYHEQSGHSVTWDSPRFEICKLETIEYKIERVK